VHLAVRLGQPGKDDSVARSIASSHGTMFLRRGFAL
jgi:hypothetical protein